MYTTNFQNMDSHSPLNKVMPTNISKDDDEEAYILAVQVCTSSVIVPALIAAVQLDLFEMIAKRGGGSGDPCLSPSDIASHLETQNPDAPSMIDHVLRLLASCSFFTCTSRTLKDGKVERLYGLAPAGKFFVRNEDGVSLAPFVHLSSCRAWGEVWYHIKDAILEGGVPWVKAHNMPFYECMGPEYGFGHHFDRSMSDNSTIVLKKIVEKYKGFEGITSLVDVGGGVGTTLKMIISKYPSITGINFDLPHVIEKAPSYDDGRMKHVGGDMFEGIPSGAAILLKWICHNWSDEKCLAILKNCYLALPDAGKVILIESISPTEPETGALARFVTQLDSIMFVTSGGREKTKQEYEALAKGAGFSGIQFVCCVYGQCVMELIK